MRAMRFRVDEKGHPTFELGIPVINGLLTTSSLYMQFAVMGEGYCLFSGKIYDQPDPCVPVSVCADCGQALEAFPAEIRSESGSAIEYWHPDVGPYSPVVDLATTTFGLMLYADILPEGQFRGVLEEDGRQDRRVLLLLEGENPDPGHSLSFEPKNKVQVIGSVSATLDDTMVEWSLMVAEPEAEIVVKWPMRSDSANHSRIIFDQHGLPRHEFEVDKHLQPVGY